MKLELESMISAGREEAPKNANGLATRARSSLKIAQMVHDRDILGKFDSVLVSEIERWIMVAYAASGAACC